MYELMDDPGDIELNAVHVCLALGVVHAGILGIHEVAEAVFILPWFSLSQLAICPALQEFCESQGLMSHSLLL